MKQSKNTSVIRCCILLFFLALSLLIWFVHNGVPDCKEGALYWDDVKVISEIFFGERAPSNWHSALFVYEGIGIVKLWQMFIHGSTPPKYGVLFIFWVWSMITTYACLCVWLNKWMKIHLLYALCCLPLAALYGVRFLYIGLDSFFLSIILLLATLVMLAREKRDVSAVYKIVTGCVILFLLVHMVSYRRNSLLLVPIVCYAFLPVLNAEMTKKIRILYAMIATVVCFIICGPITGIVFPTQYTHPVTPMLASDMRLAVTLRGEQESTDNPYIGGNSLGYLSPSMDLGDYIQSNAPTWQERQDASWALFRDRYIQEWVNHPSDMLMSKFIQISEFYTGGNLPTWLKDFIEDKYPAIKDNPKAWKMHGAMTPLGARYLTYRYVVLIPAFLGLILYVRRKNHRLFSLTGTMENGLLMSLSFVYALSFLVATPTWDYRYLMPSVLLASCVTFPMSISLILIIIADLKQKTKKAA